ncbi:MAG: polyphosphate glucokinase [Pseudonocardiales bacterium]|nr:polyphosphate glucokinase [Pseudonocardiales bacterium]
MTVTRKPVSSAASAFGIDIGGTGMKGAPVDTATGQLLSDRQRIATPHPATPDAVAAVVSTLLTDANWSGLVGATFPAIIKHGVADSAANVDKSWIGTDVDAVFTKASPSGTDVIVLNDADAAGLAEARFGAARGVSGVVILLTFGTGIGSALLMDGQLVPNTELGHLELGGYDAETRAAASVRDHEGLSYKRWAKRVNAYMRHVEALFSPDLFVVGGGVSKVAEKWVPHLKLKTPVKPAELLNNAGIVGAAMAAAERRGE